MAYAGLSRAMRIFRSERRGGAPRFWRFSRWISGVLTAALLALNVLVLDWWRGAHVRLIESAPQVRVMDRLTIALTENVPVRIGRDHLGQTYVRGSVTAGSAAAPEHIELVLRVPDRTDPAKDSVEIRNVAMYRRLWLDFADGFRTFAERFEIPPGTVADTRFALPGGATITLRNVSREGFELWTTQGERGQANPAAGGAQTTCPQSAGPFRYRQESLLRWVWRTLTLELPAGAADRDVVAAHIGGQSTDDQARPMQICLGTALDWDQLRLVYRGDRLFLGVGRDLDRARYPITQELLKPQKDELLDKSRNVYGFPQIAWTMAPPPSAPERGVIQRIWALVWAPERRPEDAHVLRNFIAGRTTYEVKFPQRPAGGTGAVRRNIEIVPERRVMFQSISECVGDPPPEGCPVPIAKLIAGPGGKQCGTVDAFTQCWHATTSVVGSGTTALLKTNPRGLLPIAAGPASSLSEIAATKWLVLLLALLLVVAFRPRGSSDLFFDSASRGGIAKALRSIPVRWLLIVTSVGLALLPELLAVGGRYLGEVGPFAQGLSPAAAMAVLIVNWGLAGFALIVLTPMAALSVGIAWLAVTVLAAVGSLTLFSLAVDGPSTHWLSFFLKHKYLFLDSVPPAVTAMAAVSRVRVRRAIRAVLLERGIGPALARISAPALLAVFFLLWIFAGSQTGVAGFQPIEAGKFVAVILIAAVLVGLVGYAEDVRLRIGLWEHGISLVAFGSFAALLFAAPFWRRDFSPALIVLLLGASVGSIYLFFASLNVLRAAIQRKETRMRIPLAFRPLVHRGFLRGNPWPLKLRRRLRFVGQPLAAFLILCALLGALVFASKLYDFGIRTLLHVAQWTEPDTRSERIDSITSAMGQGRHVPAQRFVAWYDLDFTELNTGKRPRAEFRDLEFHVIRSRTEVAYGDCSESTPLDPRSRWWGGWIKSALDAATSGIMDVTVGRAGLESLCAPFKLRNPQAQSEREDVDVGGRELTESLEPIEIPVAENDFTAAYMLARYGVALGIVLYLAQVTLVLMVLQGLARIHLGAPNALADVHVRQFLGVMLAGSMTLYVLQWGLSWSNVLGLLPVMGQPMTWLSAGNSHHFFMALPCLLIILMTLRLAGRVPSPPRHRTPPSRTNRGWRT